MLTESVPAASAPGHRELVSSMRSEAGRSDYLERLLARTRPVPLHRRLHRSPRDGNGGADRRRTRYFNELISVGQAGKFVMGPRRQTSRSWINHLPFSLTNLSV